MPCSVQNSTTTVNITKHKSTKHHSRSTQCVFCITLYNAVDDMLSTDQRTTQHTRQHNTFHSAHTQTSIKWRVFDQRRALH